MSITQEYVKTKPYILFINQIETVKENSGIPKKALNQASEKLKEGGSNCVLPIVCLTNTEDKYHLLTGLPIYEAAKAAGLEEIWVFLVAAQQAEAQKWIEQTLMLSKLNETVVEAQDTTDFLEFINDKTSDLTSVKGIGPKTAQKLIENGPYKSLEDLQKKLGPKRSLNWIRAFKRR
jgi:5'-3' exonuclease